MKIKKIKGKIIRTRDLSMTAREITIKLDSDIEFIPGSFVNIFMNINGSSVRRAYSISSSENNQNEINISVRLGKNGTMSPEFWKEDILGREIDIMGPLGLNTADKMLHNKIFLFAYGIGAGVVKSLTDHFVSKGNKYDLTIFTGSRTSEDIIHREYFDSLSVHKNVHVSYIISDKNDASEFKKGYIQEFINELDFNNSDVYVCGHEKACDELVAKIKTLNPEGCSFFIEGFH